MTKLDFLLSLCSRLFPLFLPRLVFLSRLIVTVICPTFLLEWKRRTSAVVGAANRKDRGRVKNNTLRGKCSDKAIFLAGSWISLFLLSFVLCLLGEGEKEAQFKWKKGEFGGL